MFRYLLPNNEIDEVIRMLHVDNGTDGFDGLSLNLVGALFFMTSI